MGLPELIANSPVPGSVRSIATLSAPVTTTGATTISTSAPAPTLLQGTGQFRIVVDSEIMLVTGGANTTTWTVARKQEGSTAATHLSGVQIFHDLTREGLLNTIIGLAVTSQVKQLGATLTGNITPNIGEARVFKGTMTGNCAIQAPTGLPGVIASTLYWEIELEGEHTITFPGVTGWRFGNQPPQQPVVNRYTFFTDDGVHVYGVGSEGLPANTVIAAPGAAGEVLTSTGTAYAPAPPAGGVSEAEVKALIKALSILTGEHPTSITNAPALNDVLLGLSSSTAQWQSFISVLLEHGGQTMLIPHEPVTANLTLQVDGFYPVTTAGVKLATPEGELAVPRLVVVQNNSGGQIKMTGPFTPGSVTVTTIELETGTTTWFLGYGNPTGWVRIADSRTQAQLEAIIKALTAGTWTPLNLGPSVKQAEGLEAWPQGARLEAGGTATRLRGMVEVNAAEEVKTSQTLFIIPVGMRPTSETWLRALTTTGESVILKMSTAGVCKPFLKTRVAGEKIILDGVTFSVS